VDLLTEGSTGAMDEDLRTAIFRALALDGEACIEFAQEHSWRRSTENFLLFQRRQQPTTQLIAVPRAG